MAQNGYGPTAGHLGRIPNYGKNQPTTNPEPPACIQNAMMTKDKKPFTYTPGGLDLSQIKTPSMARRLARQRSQEEHEQAWAQQQPNNYYQPQGAPAPPPPPPPQAPPPPPPLIIPNQPATKSPKPVVPGERPEIIIPDNPIGMLRKTNSPYHWESEQAELQKMSQMPKFVEKVPSPLTVANRPTRGPSNFQSQNYPSKQPESPIHRPEAQYAHQNSSSPSINGSPHTRESLQRQDSQFNKSPQPFGGQSPLGNGSQYLPSPNNNWRQPEKRDSPLKNINNSPISPEVNRSPFIANVQQFSPNNQIQSPPANTSPVYSTLPRAGVRNQDNYVNNGPNNHNNAYNNNNYNNPIFNNTREVRPQSPSVDPSNPTPWRANTLNRQSREPETQQTAYHNRLNANQQPTYTPPWQTNETNNNNQVENSYFPSWKQENKSRENQMPNQQHQYNPPWVHDANNNRPLENLNSSWKSPSTENRNAPISPSNQNQPQQQPRYQSTMSIPVTSRKSNQQQPPIESNGSAPQREIVYVNEEPVYYCPESPNSIPPWVKTQKEKTKTPPPEWCQRPLDGRRSAPRELVTPPRETSEPEWVKKSNEMQRGVREVISPPKYQQPVQPTWSTRPSENRKSLPRDSAPNMQGKVVPIQIEGAGHRQANHHPQLRVTIDMQNPQNQSSLSHPTQRIMRVLSPQLIRLDDDPAQAELPTLNKNYFNDHESHTNRSHQSNMEQPKTRIIPIQIEGGNGGANNRVYYHKFIQEGPPRQSKAFRVLQVITGTQDTDDIQHMEYHHGFSDL